MAKFMLSLRDESFQHLITEAEDRGITVQELLRAVVIPDWVKQTAYSRNVKVTPVTMPRLVAPNNGDGRDHIDRIFGPTRRVERSLSPQTAR